VNLKFKPTSEEFSMQSSLNCKDYYPFCYSKQKQIGNGKNTLKIFQYLPELKREAAE